MEEEKCCPWCRGSLRWYTSALQKRNDAENQLLFSFCWWS